MKPRLFLVGLFLAFFAGTASCQYPSVQVMPCAKAAQSIVPVSIADTADHDVLAAVPGKIWDVYQVSIANSSATPTEVFIYLNGSVAGTLLGYASAPAQNPGGLPIPTGFSLSGTASGAAVSVNRKITLKAVDAVSTLYITVFACAR